MAFGALCSIGLAFPAIGHARDLELSPSSKWLMNYDEDSCTLARAFGEGDDQVVATIIRYEPGSDFDFRLVGRPFRGTTSQPVLRIRFGSTGPFATSEAMRGTSGTGAKRRPMLFSEGRLDNRDRRSMRSPDRQDMSAAEGNEGRVDPALEAAVTSVTVVFSGRTIILNLGSMAAPMREMRKCTADLVKLWGLDPDEQEGLLSKPFPRSDPNHWLSSGDYPSGSLAKGEQAIIRYRLMIDAEGRPTTCAIQSAIARGSFAAVSCEALKRRARFEPARKADGSVTASYNVGQIRWVIQQ